MKGFTLGFTIMFIMALVMSAKLITYFIQYGDPEVMPIIAFSVFSAFGFGMILLTDAQQILFKKEGA